MIFYVDIFRSIQNIRFIKNFRLYCFSLVKPSESSFSTFGRNFFHDHTSITEFRLQTWHWTVSVCQNILKPSFSTKILRMVVWWYHFIDKLHPDPWLWHWGTKTVQCQDAAHCALHFWSVFRPVTHVAAGKQFHQWLSPSIPTLTVRRSHLFCSLLSHQLSETKVLKPSWCVPELVQMCHYMNQVEKACTCNMQTGKSILIKLGIHRTCNLVIVFL